MKLWLAQLDTDKQQLAEPPQRPLLLGAWLTQQEAYENGRLLALQMGHDPDDEEEAMSGISWRIQLDEIPIWV